MKKSTRKEIKALDSMRLPELQARFAEVTGKETKAPNRKYLVRTITEALEARDAAEAEAAAPADAESLAPTAKKAKASPAAETETDTSDAEVKLTKLSVEELRARYAEVIQRETSSTNRAYVEPADMWSLRRRHLLTAA